ncbi:hypothetical protein AA0114_g430 [Alternaria tenuissima]|uniref:Uncharacterized protein n=1 Tax=Alternaria tenuissima TaxID=119927 RepID=A0A4V1WPL4_9PLEO|nr:hypothetical protein AA0114_g430 [Alternaria tenuissima]
MRSLKHTLALCVFATHAAICTTAQRTGAPSDSPQDSDIFQSSYLGGEHNIDPSELSQFTQIWNASFNADEKVASTAFCVSFVILTNIHGALGASPCTYPLFYGSSNCIHGLNRKPHQNLRCRNRPATE